MLVVGSKALKYRFPHIDRDPADVDVIAFLCDVETLTKDLRPREVVEGPGIVALKGIANRNEVFDTPNVEVLLADDSKALRMYLTYQSLQMGDELFASPEILYSLKSSHINFPVKFTKHIWDFLLLDSHFKGVDVLSEVTLNNRRETEVRLGGQRTPRLNQSVKDFFGQSKNKVRSYFIHDDMHRAVAHHNEPLYLRMQVDRDMARCERNLWEAFSHEDKCKCVLEEAYVIALERKILPALHEDSPTWHTPSEALEWALMRICTNLTSGWFRDFATRNYGHIRQMASESYVDEFLAKVQDGHISRVESL